MKPGTLPLPSPTPQARIAARPPGSRTDSPCRMVILPPRRRQVATNTRMHHRVITLFAAVAAYDSNPLRLAVCR
jgi:hypothetical protein